jgi:hypothetical protein
MVSLLIWLLFALPKTAAAAGQQKTGEQARLQAAWRKAIVKVRLPGKGTFEATYPSKVWRKVKYKFVPKRYPMVPPHGPRPLIIGNTNDVSAQAPSGHITQATGSFTNVTGVTSETGLVGNTGTPVANAYTIQLNTNFFTSTVAGSPAACQGWEQFIFENDGGTSTNVFADIQYWLINYGAASPPGSGWISAAPYGFPGDWFRNSTSFSIVPNQAITNLQNLSLEGQVQAGSDSYVFTVGSTAYAGTGDNSVNAASGWTAAEFCVVGDGGGGQANFNTGSNIVTRTVIAYGGTTAPNCLAMGFTGETNNLSFGPSAPSATGPGPALLVTESSAGGSPSFCSAATSVGDTHMTTFNGLLYDFQASGDFLLAQAPGFKVQGRLVSGAPTWPNASVNHAVATQMGKTKVAIGIGPKLIVNGKVANLGDGHALYTNGVTVWRKGNVYWVTSRNGNTLRATVNAFWIDAWVSFGQCYTNARGLLVNANGNVNQLEARNGTVITNPFSFSDLYSLYGNSWRVAPKNSLLCVFRDEKLVAANPQKTFGVSDLDPKLYARARAAAREAGVREGALLNAATLDIAFFGTEKAARVFVGAPKPVAVGRVVVRARGHTTRKRS